MKPSSREDMLKSDYDKFITAKPVAPPQWLSERIQSTVHADLNPSQWWILLKLSLIHFATGMVSLMFCPQFEFGFTQGLGLAHYFMSLGEAGCMAACGAIFLAGSALVAGLVLRPEELRALRHTQVFQYFGLALLSTAAFVCVGAEVAIGWAAVWLAGGVIGGVAGQQLGLVIRLLLRKGKLLAS